MRQKNKIKNRVLAYRMLIMIVLLLPGTVTLLFSQAPGSANFRLLFYNTGNFFDTVNDSTTNDDEFLPGGVMRWTYTRYRKKVNGMYKVIMASGGWEPPAIIGLCEVENRKVLEDLAYGTYLSKYNYEIIHYESDDPRGIDVAVLYRRDVVRNIGSRTLIPPGYDRSNFKTRSVLQTDWIVSGDTLYLFLNHWPSRRGGVLAGEELRKNIAGMVRASSDSINNACNGNARIIIAGDFNCTPDDVEMQIIIGGKLYRNLSSRAREGIAGTYKYRGAWEMIDQIIVSRMLLDSSGGIFTTEESAGIITTDFLLRKDNTYPGVAPNSTYTGYKYTGGFSDHLPVYLDISVRPDR